VAVDGLEASANNATTAILIAERVAKCVHHCHYRPPQGPLRVDMVASEPMIPSHAHIHGTSPRNPSEAAQTRRLGTGPRSSSLGCLGAPKLMPYHDET
jgi:hypothetical protein